MSLINKMLQDLDARGSQSKAALPPEIKPVLVGEARLPVRQIALGVTVLVLAMAVSAWFWLRTPAPQAAAVKPLAMGGAPAVQVVTAPLAPLPAAKAMNETVPSPAAPVAAPAPAVTVTPDRPAVKVAKPVRAAAPTPAKVSALPAPAAPLAPAGGRVMTDVQRAESLYRKAMAELDEGRVAGALDGLEQTLRLNPRHEGARQSLASLLIETGRTDEAMQQLEQGLVLDPAQPSMAMLLARLQIERGSSGVPVLQRSLPAANGDGDYHAFLGGALQREQRHREAVEQYAAALRTNPEHGVWLMGAGISLQAEKRNAEALTAFQRARSSGMLSAPLVAFVERKLQQLAP